MGLQVPCVASGDLHDEGVLLLEDLELRYPVSAAASYSIYRFPRFFRLLYTSHLPSGLRLSLPLLPHTIHPINGLM